MPFRLLFWHLCARILVPFYRERLVLSYDTQKLTSSLLYWWSREVVVAQSQRAKYCVEILNDDKAVM